MRTCLQWFVAVWVGVAVCNAARAEESPSAAATPGEPSSLFDPGSCDCDCLDCCDNFQDKPRFLGMLASDHCFDRFISPISNPFFFEDPRQLTEARGIFIDNNLPAQIGDRELQVWAGQFRGRLSENVSVIAPRLGYVHINGGGSGAPVGFLSAPVGLKFTLFRDVERQFLLAAGATYFIPGSQRAFSGFGSGDFHFFLSGAKQIFDNAHWVSGTGFRIPADPTWGTQMWYWSNQWDYELPNHIYPLVGVNWYHWMRSSGAGFTGPITGLDLINLPAAGVAGSNAVTSVIGLKWKPSGHFEIGGGYEFKVSQNADVLQNRVYADVIFRY